MPLDQNQMMAQLLQNNPSYGVPGVGAGMPGTQSGAPASPQMRPTVVPTNAYNQLQNMQGMGMQAPAMQNQLMQLQAPYNR